MNELSSRLRLLQEEYARRLPEKLDQMEELWNKLLYVDWRDDLFALLQRMVHNLAGSGQSFGFPELSERAAELDKYLQPFIQHGKPPSDDMRQEVSTALAQLRSLAGSTISLPDAATEAPGDDIRQPRPLVYVVDDDPELCAYLQLQLGLHGFRGESFTDIDAALAAVGEQKPAAVLMDVMFPSSYRAGIDAVSELRARRAARIPILFMSARTDMTARLEALRAGGDAYFTKPLDIEALRQKLNQLVLEAADDAHRVLLVSHDAARGEAQCEALTSVGMACRQLRNGLRLIEEIVEFRPDLVLMDRRGKDWDGMELATAIRQDEQFAFMPIVFSLEANDPSLRDQALRQGIDDIIAADAPVAELAACVSERIHSAVRVAARARMVSVRDPLTGTLNRRCFLAQADHATIVAPRGGRGTGLLYVILDHAAGLRRELGAACFRSLISQVSKRIQGAVDGDAAVAYFGNGIFTVMVRGADRAAAEAHGQALLRAVAGSPMEACGQTHRVSCSVGVAVQERGTADAGALLARAERAAAQAQEQGGGQLCREREVVAAADDAQVDGDAAAAVDHAVQERAFHLVYQPVLRLHGEHEEMYEALLRMQDEQGRAIAPATFMAHLRDNKRMADVDRWVIEHAIETLAADRRTRGRTRFFIKLSAPSLGNRMLPMWISNCIRNSRLIGEGRLVFEAKEADIAAHLEQTVTLVKALRQLHCGLAVERFGSTDAASVVLEQLKPEYVKVRADAGDLEATRQRVEQGAAAGAQVIVAHVEDTAALAALWDMGVRYFQGYAVRSPACDLDFDFDTALGMAPRAADLTE